MAWKPIRRGAGCTGQVHPRIPGACDTAEKVRIQDEMSLFEDALTKKGDIPLPCSTHFIHPVASRPAELHSFHILGRLDSEPTDIIHSSHFTDTKVLPRKRPFTLHCRSSTVSPFALRRLPPEPTRAKRNLKSRSSLLSWRSRTTGPVLAVIQDQ